MKKLLRVRKLLQRIMRITLLQTVLIGLTLTLGYAHEAHTQGLLDRTVSVKANNQELRKVLSRIEKDVDVKFVYSSTVIQPDRRVSVKAEQRKFSEVLAMVLEPLDISYRVIGGQIMLTTVPIDPISITELERNLAIVSQNVTGSVTDENGAVLPGVSVLVKGTQKGTTTNEEGSYRLEVENPAATLVFSFVGYVSQEISVGNRSIIDVSLGPDLKSLDEVIVVGYGTQKKSDLTGSVSSLKEEDFNPGANASVDQLILGRASGVQINQTSSEPGGGVSVRIRGASSLNAGNEPLYVIDGLPVDNSSSLSASGGGTGTSSNLNPRNPLNSLNPNDIASIEILKDASATAIYGSRGANGVILITTKKGKNGKVGVNYDFNYGLQSVAKPLEILPTAQYIQFINAIAREEGRNLEFTDADIATIGTGTDWQKEIYRQAPLSSHNVSVSGGDDKTTFFTSLNYFDQQGVVKASGIKKYIARINLGRKFGDKAEIGINLNTSVLKDRNNVDGVNVNETGGPINSALLYDPTEAVRNEDGRFSQSKNLTINNPVSLIEGIKSSILTNRTLGNAFVRYTLAKGLDAKLNFGSDRQTVRRDIYNTTLTLNGAAAGGLAGIATLERSNVLLEYTMNYSKTLGEKSKISVLGGATYQYFNSRNFSGSIRGFPSDALGTDNLGLGDTNNDALSSFQEDNTLLSYLGRVNYSLSDKYLLTASLRADGSSRFGANNKYGYFPSVALGWRLSEENFIPELFYDLKLRASWGLTGNQDIDNYASLSTYTTGANAVLNNSVLVGTRPSRIANPNLKWETTEQLNIGLDASVFQGRITVTLDYFVKNTRDMLIDLPLPRATGFGSILTNVGRMSNKGVELLINSTNINLPRFSWNTTLNFTSVRNKVTDLGDVSRIISGDVQFVGPTVQVIEGEPAYSYYGYEVIGIFQTKEEVAASAQPNSKPGYPIFRDTNGDNTITPLDQKSIGSPFPNFTFGLNNSFTFKRLNFSFFFQGQQGADLLNVNVIESMYPNNARRNKLTPQVVDRWTPENPGAKWPSGVQPPAYGGGKVNSLVVQDASYIRLRNLQLSYNLPVEKVKFIDSARLSLTGQNLFTFTDYVGFDPEANAFGRSNVRIDYNGYPIARTWTLGVNVGF